MRSAILRFAPVFTPLLVDDARLVRKYMVERGALVPLSYQKPTPVIVNHDDSRQIGTVRSLVIYDDVITGTLVAPYYFAHVDITEPTAMRSGDGVSWGFHLLHELEIAGTKLIRKALITEVSVLTPAVKPAEPFARVCWIGEKETSSPAAMSTTTSDRASSPARVLEKREPRFQTRSPLDRLYEEHMASKRTEPQVITRHGIGQVIGVR